jgi:hypothetical protein
LIQHGGHIKFSGAQVAASLVIEFGRVWQHGTGQMHFKAFRVVGKRHEI